MLLKIANENEYRSYWRDVAIQYLAKYHGIGSKNEPFKKWLVKTGIEKEIKLSPEEKKRIAKRAHDKAAKIINKDKSK